MSKSEAQTRSELIDQQLAQSGWNVKDPTQVIEEFDILTPLPEGVAEARTPYEGHQFSDYVLLGEEKRDRLLLRGHGNPAPHPTPRLASADADERPGEGELTVWYKIQRGIFQERRRPCEKTQ